MGFFDFLNPKKTTKEIDFVDAQFEILKHSKELIKLAIGKNNNDLVILSKEDFIQIRKVYDILNNYQTNSNYLLVYIFNNNVKFNTHNITFKGLDTKYLNYFISNTFPIKLFQEESNGVKLIKPFVFKQLFDIDDIELFKLLDKSNDFEMSIVKYNANKIENRYSKNDLLFLINIKDKYKLKELLNYEFYYNSIYSIIYTFNFEKLDNEEYILKYSEKMLNLLKIYYCEDIYLSNLFIFLQGINNKELLDFIYKLVKVLDGDEFETLSTENKNIIINNQMDKINSMILENINKLEKNNLNTLNELLNNL